MAINKFKDYNTEFSQQIDNKIMTGFTQFDESCGGISSGLTMLAGISSLGKSSLCSQLSDQIALAGNKVIYLNAEMQDKDIYAKSIIRLSERHGQLDYNDIVSMKNCTNELKVCSFVNSIGDYKTIAENTLIKQATPNWNTELLRDIKALKKINNGKSPVVFIDYLQILPVMKKTVNKGSEYSALNDIIAELKNIINETNCYIICISGLNRESYSTGIGLKSLKGSSNIEYSSEMILAIEPHKNEEFENNPIWNDKKGEYNEEVVKAWKSLPQKVISLSVLKNRNGRSGETFPLLFQSSKFKFSQI